MRSFRRALTLSMIVSASLTAPANAAVLHHIGVEEGVFVERPIKATLGRRSIVADNVDDHRVVGVWQGLDIVEDPSDLLINMIAVSGEDLHHPGVELLLVAVEAIPCREACGTLGQNPTSRW
jgi:hypothetical protein